MALCSLAIAWRWGIQHSRYVLLVKILASGFLVGYASFFVPLFHTFNLFKSCWRPFWAWLAIPLRMVALRQLLSALWRFCPVNSPSLRSAPLLQRMIYFKIVQYITKASCAELFSFFLLGPLSQKTVQDTSAQNNSIESKPLKRNRVALNVQRKSVSVLLSLSHPRLRIFLLVQLKRCIIAMKANIIQWEFFRFRNLFIKKSAKARNVSAFCLKQSAIGSSRRAFSWLWRKMS